MKVLYAHGRRGAERDALLAAPSLHVAEVCLTPRRGWARFLSLSARFGALLARERPDVVLFEHPGLASWAAARACRRAGVPYVLRMNGDIWREGREGLGGLSPVAAAKRRLRVLAAAGSLPGAAAVLPIADHIAARCREERVGAPLEVVPIPAPPDDGAAESIRDPLLLTVTNFRFWPKVEPLVRLAPRIAAVARSAGWTWVVLGDGPFLPRFRTAAGSDVVAPGWADPAPLFGRAGALVHPSGLDGLPRVLLEAAMRGVAIMVHAGSPLETLARDGLSAVVLHPDPPGELERELASLLGDADALRARGRAAAAGVRERWGVEVVARRMEAALRRAVSAPGTAAPGGMVDRVGPQGPIPALAEAELD